MARGGSRRFGKVWSVQPSGWGYGPTTEGCGPLTCSTPGERPPCKGSCQGIEASHSFSWYWRVWYHAWFAGAAKLTEEGPATGVFSCNEPTGLPTGSCVAGAGCDTHQVNTSFGSLSPLGLIAQSVLRTARTHDRGTPLTPLAIITDLYVGYNTGAQAADPSTDGVAAWGVLPMSLHDKAIDYLFHSQLFVASGLPDEELKTTPHGEIADVVLSDSGAEGMVVVFFGFCVFCVRGGGCHPTSAIARRFSLRPHARWL